MKFTEFDLPGVFLIQPDVYHDERGFFLETFNIEKYRPYIPDPFVQDNRSVSGKNILRGLHLQNPNQQGKLVSVTHGEILDVAVDVRAGSPTFGQWHAETLTEDNFHQFYIPPGFAHGFCVLSDKVEVHYKCTNTYHPDDELVIIWNDSTIGIDWPLSDPQLSDRDRKGLTLDEALESGRLPTYTP